MVLCSSLVSMLQERASRQNPPLSAEDQTFRGGNSIFLDKHNKEKILSYVSCFYSKLFEKITFLKLASWLIFYKKIGWSLSLQKDKWRG